MTSSNLWKIFQTPVFKFLITILLLNSERNVSMSLSSVKSIGSPVINFTNDENIRESVLKTMRLTLKHMMSVCVDNTKLFVIIAMVLLVNKCFTQY